MQKTPRIAIVHEYLTRMGGAEKTAKVIADLFPSARIFTLLYDEANCGKDFPKWRVETSRLQNLPEFLRKRPKFLLPFLPSAVESFNFDNYDLVISSSSAFAHGLVLPLKNRHICYCHSPARFLWDYSHEYLHENKISGIKKILLNTKLKDLRIWSRLSARRVDRFLANSATVQRRIQKYFRTDSEVVHPPVEVSKIRVSDHHENYFLIVSQLAGYKKIELAISVFNKLRRRLVIVGDGPRREFLESIAGPTIEFLGWRSDQEVRELLGSCRGFIFPGEDDFGIAPVEAMAAGKPVLAFNRGGATETVQHKKTGTLFDSQTPESLENGLAEFFANEKKFDPKKIRTHARQFSRQNFEQNIRRIVNEEFAKLNLQ
ncbi:MAG: glycosyltransferase [Candidatus Peribacteraceae bacterium]|nr:glycosyltransferase [Candidatus Peribacteraceae bacterium]